MRRALPLIATLREIAKAHDRTPAQVALAWLLRDERVLPIPGAKSAEQARSNAGALSLRLDQQEFRRLDAASADYRRVPPWARWLIG